VVCFGIEGLRKLPDAELVGLCGLAETGLLSGFVKCFCPAFRLALDIPSEEEIFPAGGCFEGDPLEREMSLLLTPRGFFCDVMVF
jgi:hypothetical protein